MNIRTQKQKIWAASKEGMVLDWLLIFKLSGSSKGSTRIGEIEQEKGVKYERGWKKVHGTKVRTYWLRKK